MNLKFELIGVGRNAKTVKSDKQGDWLTAYLYLAPGNKSSYEVCPSRSPGCSASCLYTAGMGDSAHVRAARIRKTKQFFEQRSAFFATLIIDLARFQQYCHEHDKKGCVRLNMTSDIQWEKEVITKDSHKLVNEWMKQHGGVRGGRISHGLEYVSEYYGRNILEVFPHLQFYDYTKIPNRGFNEWFQPNMPSNYHLTFSLDETNMEQAKRELSYGKNLCVVFPSKKLTPKVFMGRQVIDGDSHDLRFLDPSSADGYIIGVKAKGDAFADASGFVVRGEALNPLDTTAIAEAVRGMNTDMNRLNQEIRDAIGGKAYA
jgi:hypothetical protein